MTVWRKDSSRGSGNRHQALASESQIQTSEGDLEQSARQLQLTEGLPILDVSQEAEALAAANGVQHLVTWNCT